MYLFYIFDYSNTAVKKSYSYFPTTKQKDGIRKEITIFPLFYMNIPLIC